MEPARGKMAASRLESEPEEVTKGELVARLREPLKGDDMSWFIADERPFDWAEINLNKEKFMADILATDFGSATMSVHVHGKGSAYSSYRIAG